MRIAVMGAGSLGTIAGALTAKNGGDVVLIDSYKEHVDELNKSGATVVGELEITVPVKAITPEEMDGIYDVVLYTVKQTANESALNQLLPHLGADSVVVTFQNGVPEDAVAKIVGQERTLGCTVGWGATFEKPGVSRLTSKFDKMTYELGEMDSSIRERTQKVADVLNLSGEATIVPNIIGVRWTKLLVNTTMSGLSAALGCTYGDILDNEKSLMLVAHVGDETIKIVNAREIKMEPIQGHDLSKMDFQTAKQRAAKLPFYKAMFAPHRQLKASMLQDLEKGRKTEVDAIVGVVSDWGDTLGIDTPVCDKIRDVIKDIENGKLKPVFENLDLFTVPECPEE